MIAIGKCTLDDGTRVEIIERGKFEKYSNIWQGDGQLSIIDLETGEDITDKLEEKGIIELTTSHARWKLFFSEEEEPYV